VLVIDATTRDNDSIVGEEAHIVSGRPLGPRFSPAFPQQNLDEPENLILLCRIHHKMVDDQAETYTVALLRTQKENHEQWVASKLSERDSLPRVMVRRVKENIPPMLVRLHTGAEITRVVDRALAFSFDHDAPTTESEVELLSGFLQTMQDWGDISGDLDAGQHVRMSYEIDQLVRELEGVGFLIFGGREVQRLAGGAEEPSPFPVAILHVLRSTSPSIQKIKIDAESEKNGGEPSKATP
jgi:hypothetical protein